MVMHGFGISMVVGSSLEEPKLNFIFCYFWFWTEFEGLKETLADMAAKGGWKTEYIRPLSGN